MDKSEQKGWCLKYLVQLLILTAIDYIVIRFGILGVDPDPSVSIALLFFVPAVFIINIIAAVVIAFIKKQYVGLFLINAITSSVLMYFLFLEGVKRHQNQRYETWNFNLQDTTFEIRFFKPDKTFMIHYSTEPGSSIGFMDGQYSENLTDVILTYDTTKMIIKNELLYGFRNHTDSIKLTKIER